MFRAWVNLSGSLKIDIHVIVALGPNQGYAWGEKSQLNNQERYQRILNAYWSEIHCFMMLQTWVNLSGSLKIDIHVIVAHGPNQGYAWGEKSQLYNQEWYQRVLNGYWSEINRCMIVHTRDKLWGSFKIYLQVIVALTCEQCVCLGRKITTP